MYWVPWRRPTLRTRINGISFDIHFRSNGEQYFFTISLLPLQDLKSAKIVTYGWECINDDVCNTQKEPCDNYKTKFLDDTRKRFMVYEIIVDRQWRNASTSTFCGDNECERKLTAGKTTAVTVTKGKELMNERSISNLTANSVSNSFSKGSNVEFSFGVDFSFINSAVTGGISTTDSQNTTEISFEVTTSTGITLSYSTSVETSSVFTEEVMCHGQPHTGFFLQYRATRLKISGNYCYFVDDGQGFHLCKVIKFTLLPSKNGLLTADYRCKTDLDPSGSAK